MKTAFKITGIIILLVTTGFIVLNPTPNDFLSYISPSYPCEDKHDLHYGRTANYILYSVYEYRFDCTYYNRKVGSGKFYGVLKNFYEIPKPFVPYEVNEDGTPKHQ